MEDNPNSDITSDGSSDITSEDDITSETDSISSGEEGSESEENHSSGFNPQGGNNCKSSVNGSLIMLISMAVAVAIIFKKESK